MTADPLHTDRVWRLVLCVALVLPSDAAWAQPPQRSAQVDVSRLVVDARVGDDDGRAMTGLDADDFDVRVGGQPVRVESAQWIGGAEPVPGPLASPSLGGVVGTGPRGRLVVFVVQKSLQRDRLAGLLRILHDSGRLLEPLTPDDRVAVLSFEADGMTYAAGMSEAAAPATRAVAVDMSIGRQLPLLLGLGPPHQHGAAAAGEHAATQLVDDGPHLRQAAGGRFEGQAVDDVAVWPGTGVVGLCAHVATEDVAPGPDVGGLEQAPQDDVAFGFEVVDLCVSEQ